MRAFFHEGWLTVGNLVQIPTLPLGPSLSSLLDASVTKAAGFKPAVAGRLAGSTLLAARTNPTQVGRLNVEVTGLLCSQAGWRGQSRPERAWCRSRPCGWVTPLPPRRRASGSTRRRPPHRLSRSRARRSAHWQRSCSLRAAAPPARPARRRRLCSPAGIR